MLEHILAIIIGSVISVGLGIVVEKFVMKMIDAEFCRDKYVALANGIIQAKIKRIEDYAFSLAWKLGIGIGCGVSILFFYLGIFKLNFKSIILGLFFTLLKFLTPIAFFVIMALIVATIIVDEYCIKHFGKTLAFIDMVYNAADVKQRVCKETVLPYDKGSADYGDRYLAMLGTQLNSSIRKTVWFYRIVGALVGFVGFCIIASVLMSLDVIPNNVFLIILIGIVGEIICVYFFNKYAIKYCILYFGHLSTYYQLHIDVYSIKKSYFNQSNVQGNSDSSNIGISDSSFSLTESEKQYAEEQEKLREKFLGNISLKDGYKFASVQGRVFAEKTDAPGSCCCPYCYAEVSSDVSSMCGNCGKSLGVSQEAFSSQIQPSSNESSEELIVASANDDSKCEGSFSIPNNESDSLKNYKEQPMHAERKYEISEPVEKVYALADKPCRNKLHFALVAACCLGWCAFVISLVCAINNYVICGRYEQKYNDVTQQYNNMHRQYDTLSRQYTEVNKKYDDVINAGPWGKVVKVYTDNGSADLSHNKIRYLYFDYKIYAATFLNEELHVKIIDPWGKLMRGTESPTGYSYSLGKTIYPFVSHESYGWGNDKGGSYVRGNYTIELWYHDRCIGREVVRIK